MGLFQRWRIVSAETIANHLVAVAGENPEVLLDHPYKRGGVWEKAVKRLGKKFRAIKDRFLLYAIFHSNANRVRDLVFQRMKCTQKQEMLFLKRDSLKRYCICGLPEGIAATVDMIYCKLCDEWYHYACLDVSTTQIPGEWTCQACKGIDFTSFVPSIFFSSFLSRRKEQMTETENSMDDKKGIILPVNQILDSAVDSKTEQNNDIDHVKNTSGSAEEIDLQKLDEFEVSSLPNIDPNSVFPPRPISVQSSEEGVVEKRGKNFKRDVKFFSEALVNLNNDIKKKQIDNKFSLESILMLATNSLAWSCYIDPVIKHLKLGRTASNKTITRLYRLQRYADVLSMTLKILGDCEVDPKLINKYQEECKTSIEKSLRSKNPSFIKSDKFMSDCSSLAKTSNSKQESTMREIIPEAIQSQTQLNPDFTPPKSANLLCSFNDDNFTSCTTEPEDSSVSISEDSDQEEDNASANDEKILKQKQICEILGISPNELKYRPPVSFDIILEPHLLWKYFNFSSQRFKKVIYPDLINDAMRKCNFPCSFNSRTCPYYNLKEQREGFCRLVGKCRADCKMWFSVKFEEPPQPGQNWVGRVTSAGAFGLVQEKQTGRQISGLKRKEIAALLKNGKKPYNLFLTQMHELNPLQILHQNINSKTKDVLRKLKSEVKKEERKHQNPNDELRYLKRLHSEEHNSSTKLKGYIQDINLEEDALSIHIYDRNSLILLTNLSKDDNIQLHFDATGTICRSRTEKKIYLYLLLAFLRNGISFPVGFLLTERHNFINIGSFLKKICHNICNLRPDFYFTPIGKIAVCDFSYALIHSIMDGINREKLTDYLNRCWKVLSMQDVWIPDRLCVYICSSHFIRSIRRNLAKKLCGLGSSKLKSLTEMAVCASWRFIECGSLPDFKVCCRNFCFLFGKEKLTEDELKKYENAISSKGVPVDVEEVEESENDRRYDDEEEIGKYQPIRMQSNFYKIFREISCQVDKMKDSQKAEPNPFYSPTILKVFAEEKLPLWPLWGSAVPKLVCDPDFDHLSNAAVESEFRNIKKSFLECTNGYYSDCVRDLIKFYQGRQNEALIKLPKSASRFLNPKTTTPKNPVIHTEKNEEKWNRGNRKRNNKHHSMNTTSNVAKSKEEKARAHEYLQDQTKPGNANQRKSSQDSLCLSSQVVSSCDKSNANMFNTCAFKILNIPGQIPWEGYFREGPVVRKLANTCPFDSTLFILYVINELFENGKDFFDNADRISKFNPCFSFDMLFDLIRNKKFDLAKTHWIRGCNFSKFPAITKQLKLHARTGKIDCFGTEEEMILHHLGHLFKIKETYACSNLDCKTGTIDFDPLVVPTDKIVQTSPVESVKEITTPQPFGPCKSCDGVIMKRFEWENDNKLPFFPVHGIQGHLGNDGVYVPSSTENDLNQVEIIQFGGRRFRLFAYILYASGRNHFIGVFNTVPKIQHDGMMDSPDDKCQIHVPEKSALSTLWYLDEELFQF